MSAPREMRFTFLASSDLKGIWDAIAMPVNLWGSTPSDSQAAAGEFAAAFARHCELIARNPELGLERDELVRGLRSSTFRKYVVFYRARGAGVEVVRVLNSIRDTGTRRGAGPPSP